MPAEETSRHRTRLHLSHSPPPASHHPLFFFEPFLSTAQPPIVWVNVRPGFINSRADPIPLSFGSERKDCLLMKKWILLSGLIAACVFLTGCFGLVVAHPRQKCTAQFCLGNRGVVSNSPAATPLTEAQVLALWGCARRATNQCDHDRLAIPGEHGVDHCHAGVYFRPATPVPGRP